MKRRTFVRRLLSELRWGEGYIYNAWGLTCTDAHKQTHKNAHTKEAREDCGAIKWRRSHKSRDQPPTDQSAPTQDSVSRYRAVDSTWERCVCVRSYCCHCGDQLLRPVSEDILGTGDILRENWVITFMNIWEQHKHQRKNKDIWNVRRYSGTSCNGTALREVFEYDVRKWTCEKQCLEMFLKLE